MLNTDVQLQRLTCWEEMGREGTRCWRGTEMEVEGFMQGGKECR